MSPLNRYATAYDRQRGAIGLMAALTLALAVLCMLMVVDSGRLYLEKRSLQRIADMAALEAASRKGNCLAGNSAFTYASQSAVRNSFVAGEAGRTLSSYCGVLALDANLRRTFTADSSKTEAIKVIVSHNVPRSIAAGVSAIFDATPTPSDIQLSASAVAAVTPPVAALTIRSAAMIIDSSTGPLLNAVMGGMLGGSLNLSLASWQGLAGTDINLLGYLNRLKADLNLTAVGYNQVLSNTVAVSQLIESTIKVLDPNGTLTGNATIIGLNALKASVGATTIVLGDLLKIQGTTDIAALNTDLRLFDLVQGVVQLANKKNGLMAAVPINIPGLAQVTAQVQVIQPPQLSAIGDPRKIDPLTPLGTDRIYVRTAQTRILLSANLPVLGTITPLIDAATNLLTPLTPVLNSVLSLNLASTLDATACLLGAGCQVTDFKWLSGASTGAGPKIDLSLDIGGAQTYITGYTCQSNSIKTLTTHTDTSLLNVKIGNINSADAFPASTTPGAVVPKPLPVLDIGTKICHTVLGIGTCGARTPFGAGGIGVSVNLPIGQAVSTPGTLSFSSPNLPDINRAPYFSSPLAVLPSSLLTNTVGGLQVQMYKPLTSTVLGDVISSAGSLLGSITSGMNTVISNTLTPLLTGVVDPLFKTLGLSLGPADVGANLSCNFGQATLVI